MADRSETERFWRIAGAGGGFQGGSAAVDSATIIAGAVSLNGVFMVAVVAGVFQYRAVRRLRRPTGDAG